jgi:uncharacterized protein with PQ loop repeat
MLRKLFSIESRLWLANGINILALLVQLLKILETRSVAGLSVPTWFMFAFIQITLAESAYRSKQRSAFIGMSACCVISLFIAVLAILW